MKPDPGGNFEEKCSLFMISPVLSDEKHGEIFMRCERAVADFATFKTGGMHPREP